MVSEVDQNFFYRSNGPKMAFTSYAYKNHCLELGSEIEDVVCTSEGTH
jgi:hypothetical protein